MTNTRITNPSMQNVTSLYCLIGEAVCMIQHVEGALSHSITLKKDVKYPKSLSKDESEKCLKKNQHHTLGNAIRIANENDLYSENLFKKLKSFLDERNWLIHNFVCNNLDDMHTTLTRDLLFHRIKNISNTARMLQRAIENDLIEFSESVGIDMSRVRAVLKQVYHES